ncbi:other/AgaK1 protein kinase [Coprinopsis sp. MPI-PUGE-AT-0042]|nr:other/AgaK1 protein kinase [Coprinopsis sp. MPI-PUGE-AT-0042]
MNHEPPTSCLHPECSAPSTHPEEEYCLPTGRQSWSVNAEICRVDEVWMKALDYVSRRWKFLAAYFAGCGYYLYQGLGPLHTTPSNDGPLPSPLEQVYPYSRRADGLTEKDLEFNCTQGFRIWAARDQWGREVVIRLVSFPGEESDELKIYRLLNTPEARKDPRNHTVPVVDWIEYSGLTFIVSPRWGDPIIGMVSLSADQLLHYADTLLEARRAYSLSSTYSYHFTLGARHHLWPKPQDGAACLCPAVSRFAYIDFDASVMLPMDTALDSVLMEREMRIGIAYLGLPGGKVNPFNDDIVVLLNTLQTYTRVLEAGIPEIGLFFDKYLADLSAPPSAAMVLAAFRKLRTTLTREQLEHVPKNRLWETGHGLSQPYIHEIFTHIVLQPS